MASSVALERIASNASACASSPVAMEKGRLAPGHPLQHRSSHPRCRELGGQCCSGGSSSRTRREVATRAMRTPKDPKAFASMDQLREHLQREAAEQRPGFISGTINAISDASFGAAGMQQPWWSPARIYRQLTQGLRFPGFRRGQDDGAFGPEDPNSPLTRKITACHQQLGPLLLLSRSDLRRMAHKFPQVLDMPAAEVAVRLVRLREELPGCDCCLLLEDHPRLFLSGGAQETMAAVAVAAGKLRRALKGACVADVIMADPEILFLRDLDHGLAELRDLWDVDEQALAASEAKHLALAVRSLALSPKPEQDHGVNVGA